MAGQVHLDTKEWEGFFKAVSDGVKNPKPYLRAAFSTRGFSDIIKHFEAQRGPNGAWKPRSPETQRAYARLNKKHAKYNPTNKLLQLSGNMRRNFLPGNIEDHGQNAIVFFNPTPYAAAHDDGSNKRNIPQREFMYLTDKAVDDMLNIVMDLVVK